MAPGLKFPVPPVFRISVYSVQPAAQLVKPPVSPPLPPEDDPFERAKTFRPDGPLPELPTLPPLAERPVLVLDAKGHSGMIRGMFLTPDASKVVTVSEDKSARVWDVATGDILHTIRFPGTPGAAGTLFSAALSPDGKQLAVGGIPLGNGKDGIPVYLLSVDSGRFEKAIFGVRQTPLALDFTPDGKRLAVGCSDGTIQVFDVATGKPVNETKAHSGVLRTVRFSPKGGRMASLGSEKTLIIWDAEKMTKTVTVPLAEFGPNSLAWSPDGQTLAIGGSATGAIMLMDTDGKEVKTFPGLSTRGIVQQVMRVAFTPDGKDIIWGGVGETGVAGIIEVKTGKRRVVFPHHTNTVGAVHAARDKPLVASMGGDNGEVFVWKPADGTVVRKLVGSGQGVFGVRWSTDGKSIGFGNVNRIDDQSVHGVQQTFRLDEFGFGGPPDPAKMLRPRFADDDLRLVWKNRALVEVHQNGRLLKSFRPSESGLFDAASLVPGRGLLLSGSDGLHLVNPRDGKLIRRYKGHIGPALGIAVSPDDRHFVTGSIDQTIRLWSVDRDEPLLNLFVVGREWIAWTSEGYYACSGGGEQLIAWQVNNGTAKLPTIYPAARFRPSMYQPALLKYLIPTGSAAMAMAMAQKFDQALIRATSVADVLPPEVTLTAPANEAVVDQDKITVKATAKGNAKQPVVAMRLLVDGRPFQGTEGVKRFDNPGAEAEASWEVPLVPGPHWFAVIADSPVSKGMSHVVAVTRPGEPPKPNLYVLAMGVSEYPGDMKLKYAASDARLLAKTFQTKSKGVFADIEVRVLTDSDATKKGIQEGLDWLKSKMTAKDVGIVSFSGHGMRDPLGGKFYLVPVDVSEKNPRGTCFSGDEFKSRLENMPGRLVAILDACHSGTVAEKNRPPARTDGLVRDLVSEDAGVVVMCASLGREYAIESRLSKAGFFTLGLVEGMNGHADIDQDGIVYIHELDLYASVRVAQLSGGRQTPTTGHPPGIRPFPIAKP